VKKYVSMVSTHKTTENRPDKMNIAARQVEERSAKWYQIRGQRICLGRESVGKRLADIIAELTGVFPTLGEISQSVPVSSNANSIPSYQQASTLITCNKANLDCHRCRLFDSSVADGGDPRVTSAERICV
jgi:hypothetical protein